jgi:NAD(P)-dependent dehydrogenase (short-subunit alcohol dehydrogenase family)
MNDRGSGRVINVSSGCGRMATMHPSGCTAAYRLSKAALNALTRLTAGTAARGVSVNAVCPGWIQTDMGYQDGNPARTVQEGADTIVWLATQEDPPTNGFWQDRTQLSW